MKREIRRREFLAGTLAAGLATKVLDESARGSEVNPPADQEFYELRIYRSPDAAKQSVVLNFVETALRPALNRRGIDRIGIFKPDDAKDTAVYVVIPYVSLGQLAQQNDGLEQDEAFQKAATDYFALGKNDAPYARIESRLMRAFKGLPTLSKPSAESASRVLELRIYESHNEKRARLKVEMFNEGEIDLMRKVELGPVFFGETLVSNDVPNLTYMLSASSKEAHKQHWAAFLKHPEWDRMKKLERYKGTVSKIVSVTLIPTGASEI